MALDRWMEDLYVFDPKFPSKRLRDLVIPGTHDSGCYSFPFNPLTPFISTQDKDIGAQLREGIRYFDLRITNDGSDSNPSYYIAHDTFVSDVSLDRVINDTVEFLAAHQREIVILQFSHFNASLPPFSPEVYADFFVQLFALAGNYAAKAADGDATVETIVTSGRRCIISVPAAAKASAPAEIQPYLWGAIQSLWDETTYQSGDPDRIRIFIESTAQFTTPPANEPPTKLWVAQFVLTPSFSLPVRTIPMLAKRINLEIVGWFNRTTWKTSGGTSRINIYITDFCDPSITRALVAFNQSDGFIPASVYGMNGFDLAGQRAAWAPVVVADKVYFTSLDNHLAQVSVYGTGVQVLAENCGSTPCVTSDYIFFTTPANVLMCRGSGSGGFSPFGGSGEPGFAFGTPCCVGKNVFWRGADNVLQYGVMADPSKAYSIAGTSLKYDPVAGADGYVYYVDTTTSGLYRVNGDGTESAGKLLGIAVFQTAPAIYGGYAYFGSFNGLPNRLSIMNLATGVTAPIGSCITLQTPFVDDSGIYFCALGNFVWRMDLDSQNLRCIAQQPCNTPPVIASNYAYYTTGDGNLLWKHRVVGSDTANFGFIARTTPIYHKGYFYVAADFLYRMPLNGQNALQIPLCIPRSAPAADGDTLFYQEAMTNALCSLDRNTLEVTDLIRGPVIYSSPCVTDKHVFFMGNQNQLTRCNRDGTGSQGVSAVGTIASAPVSYSNQVFVQAADNSLWRVAGDGTNAVRFTLSPGAGLAAVTIQSAPFVTGGFVYFQGSNGEQANLLYRVAATNENDAPVNLGGQAAFAPPYVRDDHVYFMGADNALMRMRKDGTGEVGNVGAYSVRDTPCVPSPDLICFRDMKSSVNVIYARLPLSTTQGV
ncbi:MAG TPA: hypothetical protein VFS20_02715 [Longimicrobium sp.]|nr:hypothetical protein [Longimicrobium sp.]